MPNLTHRANHEQIAATAADGAGLIVAHEKIKFQDPPFDETVAVLLPDGSHHAVPVERETYFPARLMRFTGTVIGFVLGGPAGAAFGSLVAALAGNFMEKQSNNIWLTLRLIGLWRARCKGNDRRPSSAEAGRPSQ